MTQNCLETGEPLKEGQGRFSSPVARHAWNNRRKSRGAELYNMFMLYRYERPLAKKLGLFAAMCTLASKWRAEDKAAGRASYILPDGEKAGQE